MLFKALALTLLAGSAAAAPVSITWQKGRCADCRITSQLDSVVFVSKHEAWAEGLRPPGATGLGEHAMLHSLDQGRIWHELGWTYAHNTPVPYSFPGGRRGWIGWSDEAGATWKIAEVAADGHIRRNIAPEQDTFLNALDMTAGGIGYATVATGKARFGLRTEDGGRTWQRQSAGGDAIVLLDAQTAWTLDDAPARREAGASPILIHRTTDGGKTWRDASISGFDHAGDVIGLWFADRRRGWLSFSYHDGFHRAVWRTTDGGASWTSDKAMQAAETRPDPWVTTIAFTDPGHGFAYARGADEKTPSDLLYTIDGGSHWRKIAFDGALSACHPWRGTVKCAATRQGKGFWVVTLKPN